MKTLVALVTATAVTTVTTASDEAKAVVIRHDGKPMRCEGYYDDCVFVVGPQTGDMRRGKRPFAKINWEVK